MNDPDQRQNTIRLYNTLKILDLQISDNPSNQEILLALDALSQAYTQLNALLNSLEITINNSLEGSVLSSTMLDGYRSLVDGLQASLTANRKAFNSFQSSARDAFTSLDDELI